MWSFFKSKPAQPRAAPVLSTESIEAGILAIKGDGVHIAVLYATMLGFEHELLNTPEAISEFMHLVQLEPEFSPEGIAVAAQRVISDVEIMCQSEAFDIHFYGLMGDENQHLKPILDPFRTAVAEFGAKDVFAAAGFDVGDFLARTSVRQRNTDLEAIFAKLDEKRPFLAPLLMRAQAQGRNKYGDTDYTDFFNELVEFLSTYFDENNLKFFYNRFPLMLCLSHVEPWLAETADILTIPSNGIDFEYWCAARIEEQGWSVRVSKASGDQGIDIEAMRDGMLVAVQCKRYTSPVGNKAVQEAYAGATHYRASKAIVIGTGGYTKAAIDLAANTGVILLDAENIAAFSTLVTEG